MPGIAGQKGIPSAFAAYAFDLAEAMGVSDQETLDALEWGALLHDVGKIGVSDQSFTSQGRFPKWSGLRCADIRIGRQTWSIFHI